MNTQIKAELRIGNKLKIGSSIITVSELYEDEFKTPEEGTISYGHRQLSGLPITEELLLKAGFEKNHRKGIFKNINNNYWVNNCVCLFYTETPPENTYLLGYGFMYDGEYYASTSQWIHYFHELQNAFRVFTGKELTL